MLGWRFRARQGAALFLWVGEMGEGMEGLGQKI